MKKTFLSLSFFASALLFAQAPTNGLLGYYGFEGNANSHNLQHNFAPPTATETPAATYQDGGKVGKAAVFSGEQALINTTLNDVLTATTPITISYWYRDSQDTQNTYGTQVEFFGSLLCRYQGALKAEINTTTGYINVDSQYTYPAAATWRHITLTYDPASNIPLALWINANRLPIQASAGRLVKPFIKAVIGNGLGSNGNLHSQKGYYGMIDELFVYNRILSASEIESVMFNTQAIATPIVSNVSSINVGNNSADINYTLNAVNGTATSQINYGTSAAALTNTATGQSGTGNNNVAVTVPLSGLLPNTIYYYTVSATNASGTVTSDVYNFTTTNAIAPAIPMVYVSEITYYSAFINYFITPNTATAITYYIEYGTAPNNMTLRTPDGENTSTQQFYTYSPIYGLSAETTYYYRVVATSVNGTTYSETSSFTTLAAPIAIVIDPVTVLETTDTTATISYALNAGIGNTTVTLNYGTSELDNQTVTIPGGNGTTQELRYTITNLTPNTHYTFSLTASNGQTTGYYTTGAFTTATLGIKPYTKNSISVYPNPAANTINIASELPLKQVIIYNIQGVAVVTANNNGVDISALQSGIYLVKVTTAGNATWETKLIKK